MLSIHPSGFKTLIIKNLFLAIAFTLLAAGCVKDKFSDLKFTYNGTLAIPLGTVGFTLAEALKNDTTLTVGSDKGISLIFRENDFFSIAADDLLDDLTGSLNEHFSKTTKLGTVAIGDSDEQFATSFGDLAADFNNQLLKQMFLQNNGNSLPVPAFQETLVSEIEVPDFDDFSHLEIASGTLSLRITNNLFVDVQSLSASIIDNASGLTIGTFAFNNLPKGSTAQSEVNLQGKAFGNDLRLVVSSLNSPGSGGVPVQIDLSKKLAFDLKIANVTIQSGQVVLQPGKLTEDQMLFGFTTDHGEKIFQIKLDGATVNYTLTSEVKTPVKVKLTFPGVFKNNNPFSYEIMVGPGSPASGQIDFAGTTWRLDLDAAQPFNRMMVLYEVVLDQTTGGQVAFSSEDKVSLDFNINGLDVQEITGHFGNRTETLDAGSLKPGFDFSVFAAGSSPLIFDNPRMNVKVANSFGIPLQVNFYAVALGLYGKQASLNPPKLSIGFPSLSQIGETVNTQFSITKNNSNLVEMLAVYPAEITYGGTAVLNTGNDPQAVNFIRSGSSLKAGVEFDLPFTFRADNLIYRDTSEALDLDLGDGLSSEDIEQAELKILYKNGMPLQTSIRIIALGANGSETLVVDNATLPSATIADGVVPPGGQATGELFVTLTQDQIRQLDTAAKTIYEIRCQTAGGGQIPVAMYTDYEVELQMGLTVKFDK